MQLSTYIGATQRGGIGSRARSGYLGDCLCHGVELPAAHRKIDEPVLAGLKRILIMALIWGRIAAVALQHRDRRHLLSCARPACRRDGRRRRPSGTIDAIWERGGTVAGNLWARVGFEGDLGFYLAGRWSGA